MELKPNTSKGICYYKKMSLKILLRHIKINIILPIYQKWVVMRLRHKKQINVVFIASSLSMWRYQNLHRLLSKHPRFNASILILPFKSYTEEQQKEDVRALISYFKQYSTSFFVGTPYKDFKSATIEELKPDIIFYPQPYLGNYEATSDYDRFKNKLLCYYPYAFWMSQNDWSYNLPLHNHAWKLFYSTELHRKDAQTYAFNKGRNIEVVGYPNADNFLFKEHINQWKPQKNPKKRIIWAPHFTIFISGHIWMADLMLTITKKYSDKVQFAFKPHPRLFTELCKHAEWGEEKASAYYHEWENMTNTQLETGEFVDLFMTSDAMIHDSGSFCVEYHYSGNPVMYIADNFEEQVAEKGEFGQLAMRQHYVGKTEEDIINFIEDVVLAGNDPMKQGREEFVKQYLLPPNGKTVAENTMDVLLKAFC